MTFNNYLKSKRTLLVYYFLFHGIALFVNVFGIEWDVSSNNINDYSTTQLLTTKNIYGYNIVENSSSQFWPIVPFFNSGKMSNGDYTDFRGIFFQYDISEFLAYTALIFLILYLRWENKYGIKKENKPNNT